MGFLVEDSVTFQDTGLTLSNFVVSADGTITGIEKNTIRSEQEDGSFLRVTTYTLRALLRVWVSLDAYQRDLVPVTQMPVSVQLTADDLNQGIFTTLYRKIAAMFAVRNVTQI